MKYNTIIFDLDGTLLDTLQDLADSVNYSLAACGLPQRTPDEVRSFVGDGVAELIARAVPTGAAASQTTRCLELFRAHYVLNMENKTTPYPGLTDLLNRLGKEGHKLAIVSNKVDSAVKGLAQSYFPGLLSAAIGECAGIARKPAPDTVFKAISDLGSDLARAVYVGDSEIDLMTAKNAGIPCIGVSWGFRGGDFLLDHGAEQVANNADELYRYLTVS